MDSFAWFITFRKTLNTSHFSLAHSQSPDSTLVHGGDLARYQVLNLGNFNKKPFSNYRGEQAFCGPQPQPLVDISISRSAAPQFPPVSQYLIFEWKLKIEKHPNIKCDGISPLDFLDLTLKPSEENRQKWIVVQ